MSRAQWKILNEPELIAKAEELKDKIAKLSVDGKLGCAKAFKIFRRRGF